METLDKYIKSKVQERVSGRYYFNTSTLRQIAKLNNMTYDGLNKEQKEHFKGHCIDIAMGIGYLRNREYYYNY